MLCASDILTHSRLLGQFLVKQGSRGDTHIKMASANGLPHQKLYLNTGTVSTCPSLCHQSRTMIWCSLYLPLSGTRNLFLWVGTRYCWRVACCAPPQYIVQFDHLIGLDNNSSFHLLFKKQHTGFWEVPDCSFWGDFCNFDAISAISKQLLSDHYIQYMSCSEGCRKIGPKWLKLHETFMQF